MSTGGGGSTTSNTVSQFKPPDYTIGPWQNYVSNATGLGAQGLPIYTGQTVAPLSQQAQLGTNMLTSLATQGSPVYDTAQTNLQATLGGAFADPYATAANPYIGNNPYLANMINQSNQRITDQFARGTAAQTDAAATREGAYGGSGYQQAQALNARALGDSLAQNTSGLLGQNYAQSANLAQQSLGLASNAVQQERNRQMQAAGMAPGYQSSDISAIQAMMGGGDAVQQYQQQLLNAGQNLFQQFTQAPWSLQDLVGAALSRASGQAGTTSTQVMGPGTSFGQNLLGAGLVGTGLWNAFGGGG